MKGTILHSAEYIVYGCDGASQNVHQSDADFTCKIRQMRMRICHAIRISTSCYSYCDSTLLLNIKQLQTE